MLCHYRTGETTRQLDDVRREGMNTAHFETYKACLARGDRAGAKAAVREFVASFTTLEEKEGWVRWYLENEKFGHKIRHEIYEQLVFPVLLHGYRQSDPWSLRWLARTIQNVQQAAALWSQVGWKTEWSLLRELLQLTPEDDDLRQELLLSHVRSFGYMEHEWPRGIVYGVDGPSVEECQHILDEIQDALLLDTGREHHNHILAFKAKVIEYRARLGQRAI